MKLKPNVAAAVYTLEAHYGARFIFRDVHADVWNRTLGERSKEELLAAIDRVVRHHTHGAPGLAEVVQALDGVWRTIKAARTDAHGNPAPQMLGYERALCLCEYGSERIVRAFNERGDLIAWPEQTVLKARENVALSLLPPPMENESSTDDADRRQLGGPTD